MAKLISTMIGDKAILSVFIETTDKSDEWCTTVASNTDVGRGYDVPIQAKILEFPHKADMFCGKGNQTLEKIYMPGEYIAIIEVKDQPVSITGPHIAHFYVTGLSISDKDVVNAKELLSCIANTYTKNKEKGENVFDNIMLNPFLDMIINMIEDVTKRNLSPYVDDRYHRIVLFGPSIIQGKYFWPTLHEGKLKSTDNLLL